MARTHRRDSSPSSNDSSTLIKKLKSSHVTQPATLGGANGHVNGSAYDPSPQFADGVLDHTNIAQLHSGYVSNEPFKYAVVEKLFQDDLLQKVKDECLSELSFTEKETDIYKVNQTGDLASLNYLTSSQISLLPNLLALRDALYSPTFRNFLRAVTGCGPLSGKKQDMSVNSYTRGCHLLNHDDVIGSRRVSYILYMPLPHIQFWQKDWGGALELYPTIVVGPDGEREPTCVPSKSIPPSWDQFIFFEVQPGQSFHSVEEVVVGGEGEDGRARLSISGWFHAAQEGEEGYVPEVFDASAKSSREQLTMTSTEFKPYSTEVDQPPEDVLQEEHIAFLSEFLNPVYLQPRTMNALASRFVEESSLELHSFLTNDLASSLEPRLRELDTKDGLGEERAGRVPPHSSGTQGGAWTVKGPPHKWRYCVLQPHEAGAPAQAVTPRAANASSDEIVRSLQDELFPSPAFRAWLAIVSRLLPTGYCVEARRFRPGLDYTLATSEEHDARLDVVLGLTPDVRRDAEAPAVRMRSRQPVEVKPRGWQAAEWGGWECYMAPHNEEDDPAVYRAGTIKKTAQEAKRTTNGAGAIGKTNGHSAPADVKMDPANGTGSADRSMKEEGGEGEPEDQEAEEEEEEEEEEDSTLLTVQPGFNRLLLVLRDERVMRFVKYVSASAEGSRWDVCGEYEVGMMKEEDDEDDS
ncbi:nuclear protein [Mycena sp. CBHHK59/15]|nr:nuclear protein [Mycena sp. CBHHK59/15]